VITIFGSSTLPTHRPTPYSLFSLAMYFHEPPSCCEPFFTTTSLSGNHLATDQQVGEERCLVLMQDGISQLGGRKSNEMVEKLFLLAKIVGVKNGLEG
jgi:hypothetical protein